MSNKKTYVFTVKRKVSIWKYETYYIDGVKDRGVAIELMKKEMDNPKFGKGFIHSELLEDLTKQLTPIENKNEATVILEFEGMNISTNKKKQDGELDNQ